MSDTDDDFDLDAMVDADAEQQLFVAAQDFAEQSAHQAAGSFDSPGASQQDRRVRQRLEDVTPAVRPALNAPPAVLDPAQQHALDMAGMGFDDFEESGTSAISGFFCSLGPEHLRQKTGCVGVVVGLFKSRLETLECFLKVLGEVVRQANS